MFLVYPKKDLKLRQIVTMGSQQDSLEEKTVTLCYGSDFVNVNFINFCCTRKDIAQVSLNFNKSQMFKISIEVLIILYS